MSGRQRFNRDASDMVSCSESLVSCEQEVVFPTLRYEIGSIQSTWSALVFTGVCGGGGLNLSSKDPGNRQQCLPDGSNPQGHLKVLQFVINWLAPLPFSG